LLRFLCAVVALAKAAAAKWPDHPRIDSATRLGAGVAGGMRVATSGAADTWFGHWSGLRPWDASLETGAMSQISRAQAERGTHQPSGPGKGGRSAHNDAIHKDHRTFNNWWDDAAVAMANANESAIARQALRRNNAPASF